MKIQNVICGLFFSFACVCWLTSGALSADLPAQPQSYTSDFAGVLDATTVNKINNVAKELEIKTTAQIAVVTIPTTTPDSIENYAVRLFQKWGIGQKGKDNGVLLLVAVNDRQVRIEVGYGLEGAVTDAKSRAIIERYIIPEFKAGQFSPGVLKGVTAVVSVVAGEYQVTITGQEGFYRDDLNQDSKKGAGLLSFLFFLFFFISIMRPRGGLYDFFLLDSMMNSRRRGGYWHDSGFGGGGGGFGGGFGGFGGGMSGGGGASGRW